MKIDILSMLAVILTIVVVSCSTVFAVECAPYADCRYQGAPLRNPDNSTKRDPKVIAAYRKLHPCPSTGLHTGACPGWALNHSISLACGGRDAVWNIGWVKNEYKTGYVILPKDVAGNSRTSPMGYLDGNGVFVNMQRYSVDRTELKINASIPPQPDTAACVNVIVK